MSSIAELREQLSASQAENAALLAENVTQDVRIKNLSAEIAELKVDWDNLCAAHSERNEEIANADIEKASALHDLQYNHETEMKRVKGHYQRRYAKLKDNFKKLHDVLIDTRLLNIVTMEKLRKAHQIELADKDMALADRETALADKEEALTDKEMALASKEMALSVKESEKMKLDIRAIQSQLAAMKMKGDKDSNDGALKRKRSCKDKE
ncbi:hypothetical protein P171DRAFT_479201 [Karstenula rhodostoma CBS 690.94]|uniref:Uncharacterized protein n=1 Tax=Karstenula rhodostoma CBS 690.94 TaxID=1392251 RepID=A0A9P4PVK7_9PLEO|nr:hypothetical protein P171DRAFT_479201 [Karstenula rhodostoma CBS 690.94]